jgi:hypothetical protein
MNNRYIIVPVRGGPSILAALYPVLIADLSSCSIVEPVLCGEDEEAQEEAERISIRVLQPQQGLNEVAPGARALRHEGHSV